MTDIASSIILQDIDHCGIVSGIPERSPGYSPQADWPNQTGLPDRRFIARSERQWQWPHFPRLAFSSATDDLHGMETLVVATLPVWRNELYREFHRGV